MLFQLRKLHCFFGVSIFSHCCSLRRSRNKRGGRRGSKAARQPFSSFGMHSIRAANHASSLGSFRKHVLQHLHGVAASCANRHFRERPQKDHTFSRKTTHPARGAPPHSYCTGSTSKTKESVFCKKGPCGLFSPTYFNIFRDLQYLHSLAPVETQKFCKSSYENLLILR